MIGSYEYRLCELLNQRAKEAGFGVTHNPSSIGLFTHGDSMEFQSETYDKSILLLFNSVEEALSFLKGIDFKDRYANLTKDSYGDYPVLDYKLR